MPHKLLLADDSVTIQRVIELTFADEDVQVIAVGDGKQAINRAQQDPPDIILADVGMPERDGYEVATFIKQTPELKHIPVLLLTGAFEPIDEGRARAAGCDGVLVKPFEPQLVINRVKDLISRRPQRQAATESQPQSVPVSAPPSAPLASESAPFSRTPIDGPAVPPAAARAASPGAPAAGSIEDYFDRLDAAFSSLDTGTALGSTPEPAIPDFSAGPPPAEGSKPPFGGLGDALAGWDPDLGGDVSRDTPVIEPPPFEISWPLEADPIATPAPAVFAAPLSAPAEPDRSALSASVEAPSVVQPPRGGQRSAPPSLAEAFAALLAAEQGRPFSPAAAAPVAVDENTVEEITRRVLDRMSDRVVKETVVDLAERLVREEIDRIKANAR